MASYEWHGLVRAFVRQEMESREGRGLAGAGDRRRAALRGRGEVERAVRHALDGRMGYSCTSCCSRWRPRCCARAARTRCSSSSTRAAGRRRARGGAGARSRRLARRARPLGRSRGGYERVLDARAAPGSLERECRALLGLGKVLNLRGRHEQVLGMAERGLGAGGELPLELRARLLQIKASAHFYLGQFRAAMAQLDAVASSCPRGRTPSWWCPRSTTSRSRAPRRAVTARPRTRFRAAFAQVRGTASPRAPLYLSNLATLLIEMGDLAEARRAAEEGLAAAQRFANRAQEATCLEALAECMALPGDLDGALGALKRAEEVHDQLRMEVITSDLLAVRGRVFCARGQYLRGVEFLARAVERESTRPDSPRLTSFRAQLAWGELRAGRAHAARKRLAELLPAVERGENEDERMRVHYWLAESMLALGERKSAEPHLRSALTLVRERGYTHFLRLRAREAPAPLVDALSRGIEVDTCAAALVEAGAQSEAALLEIAEAAARRPRRRRSRCWRSAQAARPSNGCARSPAAGVHSRAQRARRWCRSRRVHGAGRRPRRPLRPRRTRGSCSSVRLGSSSGSVPCPPRRGGRSGRSTCSSCSRCGRAVRPGTSCSRRSGPVANWRLGKRNFHPTFSYIRSVLPRHAAPPLLRDAEVYRLNPDYPLSCDAWEFDAALDAARRARAGDERLEHLERALALAEQPALEGSTATGRRSSAIAIATACRPRASRPARSGARTGISPARSTTSVAPRSWTSSTRPPVSA